MTTCLIDTNVFVYALGAEHPYRAPCRDIVDQLSRGRLDGETTVVVVGEFVHQRLRQTRDRAEATRRAKAVAAVCPVRPVEPSDLELALELFDVGDRLDAFDALLAAVAFNRGVPVVLSADQAFDRVQDLRRIDPLDAEGIAALAG